MALIYEYYSTKHHQLIRIEAYAEHKIVIPFGVVTEN